MKYVSALMTMASGALRGIVASHNKGGTYFRGRVIPTNPASANQTSARSRLATLIARFRSVVTGTGRTSWATFAENTTVTDRLGNQIKLTGPNWYIKSNSIRMQGTLAITDVASSTFALSTLSPLSGTLNASAGTVSIGWNAVDDWQGNSVTAGVMLYASRPQNPTKNYFSGPFQFMGAIKSTASNSQSTFTLPFPAGIAGDRTFFRAVASAADGRPSAVFPFQLTSV